MAALTLTSTYKLKTGYEIPVLGFGTAASMAENFKIQDEDALPANLHALKCGYRHFDSARMYKSEKIIAESVRQSGLKREDVFITTKVRFLGYDQTKETIEASLSDLEVEYIDLYLIHCPFGGPEVRKGSWRALVEAKNAGKIRSIGVSNYGIHHLEETEEYIKELEAEFGKGKGGEISVGQWELHPWLTRPDITEWCKKHNVVVEAYCPIVKGQRFDEPVVQALAKKHGKTPAQILLRWSLQMGFVPLPKSTTPSRIESNAQLYDFELTGDDMESLNTGDYAPVTWDPAKSPLDN